jgi:dTDP-L-rhamnose 4-epimerase
VRHVVAAPQRAQSRLGFRAAVGFEAGVAEFATATLREPATGAASTGGQAGGTHQFVSSR